MVQFKNALIDTFLFSLPIIAGQIGHMLFGLGDTVILGHYSTRALSALGIATAIITPLKIAGLGITYIISPMKAETIARNRSVDHYYLTSSVLGITLGITLMVLQFLISFLLPSFGLEETVTTLVGRYLQITAPAMIPAILFQVFKENLQAYEHVLIPNLIIILFNGVNLLMNIFFVYYLNWGLNGTAIATFLAQAGMCYILFIYLQIKIPTPKQFCTYHFRRFLKSGIPIGLGAVVTALVFSAVTILSGKMGVTISAANNLIIIISSITFMVPYALSCAVSVKVGKKRGVGCYRGILRYGAASLSLGLLSATSMATLFFLTPRLLLGFMTSDEAVLSYGMSLLIAVALYQIPDSVMCITMGALRGMGNTFTPMIWNAVGIWLIGFPVGYYLAFTKEMQAVGLWYGLAVGLSVTAVVFVILFMQSLQKRV